MYQQHPIVALIFSIFAIFISIRQCIITHKVLKFRLFFTFILAFVCAFFCMFYVEISKDELWTEIVKYTLIGIDVIIGLYFFLSVSNSQSKQDFQNELIKTMDDTKIFVLLDKKDKIKEISELLAKEMGMSKDEAIGKKFQACIDNNLEVLSYKGNEIDNNGLWGFYKDYASKAEEGTHEAIELIVHNKASGDDVGMHYIESPIFAVGRYAGRIIIGDIKSEENLVGAEKELQHSSKELISLRQRFMSVLESAEEGIFFFDMANQSIWCNDSLVESLLLSGNSISIDEYRKYIHPDDLPLYLDKLRSLTPKNPNYEITYRYRNGADYSFVKEKGKMIFVNQRPTEIAGISNVLISGHYERTNITILDTIQTKPELLAKAAEYKAKGQVYQLALFRLDNIPELNEKYGRDAANLAISEYVKAINNHFVDDNNIYRLGGLDFCAIIKDPRKMDLLKKNLDKDEKILHVPSKYGAMVLNLEIYMGIALSKDAERPQDILKCASDALKFALKPQMSGNYMYYKDLN